MVSNANILGHQCETPRLTKLAITIQLALNRKYRERSGGPSATIAERSGAPTAGLRGRKAETDHATVVGDHRHGNFGRIPPGKPLKGRSGGGEARVPPDQ
jgi:hypothetical protein